MSSNKVSYIKINDDTILNESCIRWIKKVDECLEICAKPVGCSVGINTHKVCNQGNPDTYLKLNNNFTDDN